MSFACLVSAPLPNQSTTQHRPLHSRRACQLRRRTAVTPPFGNCHSQVRSARTSSLQFLQFVFPDPKLFHLVTRLELSDQPEWFFTTPRPTFAGLLRVSVFWQNTRVRAALARAAGFGQTNVGAAREPPQSLLQLALFRGNFSGQKLGHNLMEGPQ